MAQRPQRVYLAPDPEGIEWHWKDSVLTVRIDDLHIHNVLVIEP
jgi:hypothetical protein